MATYRTVKVCLWSDPWFEELSCKEKLCYCYLFTNEHVNNAGILAISTRKMSFESGLDTLDVENCLGRFVGDGKVIRSGELVWLVNFIKHQTSTSPKILVSIAKVLAELNDKYLIDIILSKYNTLSIPYQYPIDTVSIPPAEVEGEGEREGEEKLSCGNSDEIPTEEEKPVSKSKALAIEKYSDFATRFQGFVAQEMGRMAPKVTDALINGGAVVVDQLVRIDGFNFDEIRAALNWAVRDTFWRNQILSLGNLRVKRGGAGDQTKFQKLYTKFKSEVGTDDAPPAETVILQQRDGEATPVIPDDGKIYILDIRERLKREAEEAKRNGIGCEGANNG